MRWIGFSLFLASNLLAAPGDFVWEKELGSTIFGSPAIDKVGNIYVGTQGGDLISFGPEGGMNWMFSGASDWIDSSPTVTESGRVYVGSWDNSLYAINAHTGDLLWSFATDNLIIASPVVDQNERTYFGSYDAKFYCLDSEGSLVWAADLLNPVEASALLDEGILYVADTGGLLYALNADTGNEQWRFSVADLPSTITGSDYGFFAGPALDDTGLLFIGNENGSVYALDTQLPNGTSSINRLRWRYPTTDAVNNTPIIDTDGNIIFASRDGYLYKVDPNGVIYWEYLIGDVFYASPAVDIEGNIVAAGFTRTDVVGTTDYPVSTIHKISSGGALLWATEFEGYHDSSPKIAPHGDVFFGSSDGGLYRIEGDYRQAFSEWPCFGGSSSNRGIQNYAFEATFLDFYPNSVPVTVNTSRNSDGTLLNHEEFPWVYDSLIGWIEAMQIELNGRIWIYSTKAGWLSPVDELGRIYFKADSNNWVQAVRETNGTVRLLDLVTGESVLQF